MALRGQIICPECCNLLKSIAFEHHRKSGFIQILFPWQSSEKAQEALNSHLNCVHFSLTSSEISAADTKEVLKACFDSNRLDSVVFFHSKLKLFIAGEKKPITCILSCCCLSHACPAFSMKTRVSVFYIKNEEEMFVMP